MTFDAGPFPGRVSILTNFILCSGTRHPSRPRRLVNTSQPSPRSQFTALLSRFSPDSAVLGKRCLTRLGRSVPGAIQLVYEYSHSVVVSISPSERGYEGFAALAIYPREVRLYFQGGKDLPDPAGLLRGSGGKVRYAVIESASELDRKEMQALLKSAIRHTGITIPRARASRMIIQSVQKDKKTRKKKAKKSGRTRA